MTVTNDIVEKKVEQRTKNRGGFGFFREYEVGKNEEVILERGKSESLNTKGDTGIRYNARKESERK